MDPAIGIQAQAQSEAKLQQRFIIREIMPAEGRGTFTRVFVKDAGTQGLALSAKGAGNLLEFDLSSNRTMFWNAGAEHIFEGKVNLDNYTLR